MLKEQMCFDEEMEQGFPITLEIGAVTRQLKQLSAHEHTEDP